MVHTKAIALQKNNKIVYRNEQIIRSVFLWLRQTNTERTTEPSYGSFKYRLKRYTQSNLIVSF